MEEWRLFCDFDEDEGLQAYNLDRLEDVGFRGQGKVYEDPYQEQVDWLDDLGYSMVDDFMKLYMAAGVIRKTGDIERYRAEELDLPDTFRVTFHGNQSLGSADEMTWDYDAEMCCFRLTDCSSSRDLRVSTVTPEHLEESETRIVNQIEFRLDKLETSFRELMDKSLARQSILSKTDSSEQAYNLGSILIICGVKPNEPFTIADVARVLKHLGKKGSEWTIRNKWCSEDPTLARIDCKLVGGRWHISRKGLEQAINLAQDLPR